MSHLDTLPTTSQFPSADIVLFDGNCIFCTKGVRQLQKLDGQSRLAFTSIHDPIVAERFPDLTHERLMSQMYVIPNAEPEKRYGGAAAIRYLSRRLPKLWIAAPLLHIPFTLPLWQFLYRQVAQRRYRIGNKSSECNEKGTCELHYNQRK